MAVGGRVLVSAELFGLAAGGGAMPSRRVALRSEGGLDYSDSYSGR